MEPCTSETKNHGQKTGADTVKQLQSHVDHQAEASHNRDASTESEHADKS